MVEDTNSALWKSDGMADALQERLGGAFQAYMRVISKFREITKSLAEKLNIEGADKACSLDQECFF